jgi:diguanylate cyclase (GGDEF)-like protein
MQIDGFTVLLCGLLIRTFLGILFLLFWLRERPATWFAWWSATFFIGDLSAAFFLLSRFVPSIVPIGLETAAILAAFGCCWQGARAFEGRKPLWLPLLGLPLLWLGACLIPGFIENDGHRVVLSSLLLAPLIAMTAVEFWRGRQESLPSRWGIIVLFTSFAALFASRIPLVGVLPFPFGALPMQTNWLAALGLLMLLHTTLLAVLLVAMSRERLEREQHVRAQTDLLTGALNRRAFMAYAERLILRHQMGNAPLSLLLFDIDDFKSINDAFGHGGGDEALVNFVATTRDSLRPADFLFRLGGDELCCLLPETTAAQAHQVGERLRQRVAAATTSIAGAPLTMTTSVGAASTDSFGYDLGVLMEQADMALYAAKRQGRNRVVTAGDSRPLRPVRRGASDTGAPRAASSR